MPPEIVLIRELPLADLALVVQGGGVDHPVLLHVVVRLEALPTQITAVGSLPGVLEPVSLELDQLVERLVAVLTLVRPLLGVYRPHVVSQVAAGLEPLLTVTAGQASSAVSTGDVISDRQQYQKI